MYGTARFVTITGTILARQSPYGEQDGATDGSKLYISSDSSGAIRRSYLRPEPSGARCHPDDRHADRFGVRTIKSRADADTRLISCATWRGSLPLPCDAAPRQVVMSAAHEIRSAIPGLIAADGRRVTIASDGRCAPGPEVGGSSRQRARSTVAGGPRVPGVEGMRPTA